MSKPSAPFYYKKFGSDTYHWELLCSRNFYPKSGWKTSKRPPSGREQCNECKTTEEDDYEYDEAEDDDYEDE